MVWFALIGGSAEMSDNICLYVSENTLEPRLSVTRLSTWVVGNSDESLMLLTRGRTTLHYILSHGRSPSLWIVHFLRCQVRRNGVNQGG